MSDTADEMIQYRPGDTYDGSRVLDVEDEGNGQASLDLADGRTVVVG